LNGQPDASRTSLIGDYFLARGFDSAFAFAVAVLADFTALPLDAS
jgi:hypothetical protein